MVVRGHNLCWGALDRDGRLADVREVISSDYLHVGHTRVGDETSPRVKAWKIDEFVTDFPKIICVKGQAWVKPPWTYLSNLRKP